MANGERTVGAFIFILISLFMMAKLLNLGLFYIGFVVFGVPIIVVVTIFWYDVIIKFFNI